MWSDKAVKGPARVCTATAADCRCTRPRRAGHTRQDSIRAVSGTRPISALKGTRPRPTSTREESRWHRRREGPVPLACRPRRRHCASSAAELEAPTVNATISARRSRKIGLLVSYTPLDNLSTRSPLGRRRSPWGDTRQGMEQGEAAGQPAGPSTSTPEPATAPGPSWAGCSSGKASARPTQGRRPTAAADRGGAATPEAAAALDPHASRAAPPARGKAAHRDGTQIEEAMRAFARDYEARPPSNGRSRGPTTSPEVQRRLSIGDDDSTVLSRLSSDSLPSSQGEPSHATTQSRASLTQRPACSPIPEKRRPRRRQKLPPVVNWGCPVDTSSSALLSRPLRRKNARLTLPRAPRRRRRRNPRTRQGRRRRHGAPGPGHNALLTASLTEKLEDEHYRTTVAGDAAKTPLVGGITRWSAIGLESPSSASSSTARWPWSCSCATTGFCGDE